MERFLLKVEINYFFCIRSAAFHDVGDHFSPRTYFSLYRLATFDPLPIIPPRFPPSNQKGCNASKHLIYILLRSPKYVQEILIVSFRL